MKRISYFFLLVGVFWSLWGCGSGVNQDVVAPDVIMITTEGEVGLKLYDETPVHRDNFLKLVRENFYDSLLFHRVIYDFMIQSGDPRTRNEQTLKDTTLGDDPGYTLEAEIVESFLHTNGKLAAARYPDHLNPEWRSSGSQFYIVAGAPVSPSRLDSLELQYDYVRKGKYFSEWQAEANAGKFEGDFDAFLASKNFQNFKYTKAQRDKYLNEGGAPWLDFQYTIFGEVVSGMPVVEKICKSGTDQYDRPVKPIRVITMKLVSDN